MQTSIRLQGLYEYSRVPLIIFIFLTLFILALLIYLKIKNKRGNTVNNTVKAISEKNQKNLPAIKKKHLAQLERIESNYKNQKINLRKAYQMISEDVRLFVFEVTDITTQNYSLEEIQRLNIPKLYHLIKEYYEPEFASKSVGDFEDAIGKARGIINEWN